MKTLQNEDVRTWIVAGPADALARLDPLISAHRLFRPVLVFESFQEITPCLDQASGVLLVGDPRRSPQAALPGVFLTAANRRRVPAGWLPDAGDRLETYARAAAEVHLRRANNNKCGPVVLLGQNEQRALDLTARLAANLQDAIPAFQWTEERIVRKDLVRALKVGPGAAMYCGHGLAAGWVAYGGFDRTDAEAACGHPIGAVLSISCSIASRRRAALSFSEDLVLTGLSAGVLGAVSHTLHRNNVELALALARVLRSQTVTSLAELVSAPGVPARALNRYRIVGDPLAPLLGHADAITKARAVFAPAPDEPLPVIPLSAWTS